jgi:hypothetical protein
MTLSDSTVLNTVEDFIAGETHPPAHPPLIAEGGWSGQGIGFRTTPAGTVGVMPYLGDYQTPFVFNQLIGFYLVRQQDRATPSGTTYVETVEVNIGAAFGVDVGPKRGWQPLAFGYVFFTSTVTWSIEIVELTFNGFPQTPPVFRQYTTMPTY